MLLIIIRAKPSNNLTEDWKLKKVLTLILCITLAASAAIAETEHRGNSNNYVPPEGYGQDLNGFMYSNYKHDEASENADDYAMPLPKFLQRNKEEKAAQREPHEIKKNSDGKMKTAPMSFEQFPQNYDSSQQMFMMQNGLQNMYGMPF